MVKEMLAAQHSLCPSSRPLVTGEVCSLHRELDLLGLPNHSPRPACGFSVSSTYWQSVPASSGPTRSPSCGMREPSSIGVKLSWTREAERLWISFCPVQFVPKTKSVEQNHCRCCRTASWACSAWTPQQQPCWLFLFSSQKKCFTRPYLQLRRHLGL